MLCEKMGLKVCRQRWSTLLFSTSLVVGKQVSQRCRSTSIKFWSKLHPSFRLDEAKLIHSSNAKDTY